MLSIYHLIILKKSCDMFLFYNFCNINKLIKQKLRNLKEDKQSQV